MPCLQESLKEQIQASLLEGKKALDFLLRPESIHFIEQAAEHMARCLEQGGKIITAGNGGSLCDALHFAEELTGQFRAPRKALAALCLADGGHLTCVGNDMGFEQVFARGIEALGKKGDLFLGLSTSGKAQNIVRAFEQARKQELSTIALLGRGGGKCKGLADLELIIEGFSHADRIQEAHMCALHVVIEVLEKKLCLHA